jgi:hypothetical protein
MPVGALRAPQPGSDVVSMVETLQEVGRAIKREPASCRDD